MSDQDDLATTPSHPWELPVHYIRAEFVYIRVIGACAFAIIGGVLNILALIVIHKTGTRT